MTFLSSRADLLGPIVGRAVSCSPSGKDKAVIFKTAMATQSKCDFPLQIFCGARKGFPSFRRDNKLQPSSYTYKLTINVIKAEKSYSRIYVFNAPRLLYVLFVQISRGLEWYFLRQFPFSRPTFSSIGSRSVHSTEKYRREGNSFVRQMSVWRVQELQFNWK